MGKIIACLNEKGGVGKTTTTKNLSIGLAQKGKKVLAVDLDPSASLTKTLGLVPENGIGAICEIFQKSINFEDIPEEFGIVHQSEGIDVITSSNLLRNYETQLVSAFQREVVLRRYLYPIKDNYDYILIDCQAGLGIFSTNALFCADSVIIPLQPHFSSVEAMQNVFKLVSTVRKLNGTKTKPEILGVLFSQVRTNTSNDKNIMQELRKNYVGNVRIFDTYIPMATNLPKSDLARKSIFSYAQNSSAAMIFSDLVDEVLRIESDIQ